MSTKVLIVDDSASMRQMIAFTLTEHDYEVVQAANGKEACPLLSGDIRLIITDLYMPEMNGIDFIKYVRQSTDNKYTPIIMLTTESETDKQAEGRKAGATAWMVKPFAPEKLLETIHKIMG
jgi:two-component system chemotaxis response regulator CheY